uniref:Uncharacterized protein n=1 Tax=Ditylenchus dipsaci TaxID=166011 RepID=A0A915DTU8_9BILA
MTPYQQILKMQKWAPPVPAKTAPVQAITAPPVPVQPIQLALIPPPAQLIQPVHPPSPFCFYQQVKTEYILPVAPFEYLVPPPIISNPHQYLVPRPAIQQQYRYRPLPQERRILRNHGFWPVKHAWEIQRARDIVEYLKSHPGKTTLPAYLLRLNIYNYM